MNVGGATRINVYSQAREDGFGPVGAMGGREGPQILRHVTVGGRPAAEITATPVGRGPGRYVGRIEGDPLRFVSVEVERTPGTPAGSRSA